MRISDEQFDAYLDTLQVTMVSPRKRQRLLAGLSVERVIQEIGVHQNTLFTFEANTLSDSTTVGQKLRAYYDQLRPDPAANSFKLIRKLAGYGNIHALGRAARVSTTAFNAVERGGPYPEPARGRAIRAYQRLAKLINYPFPVSSLVAPPTPRFSYPQTLDLSRVHLRKAMGDSPANGSDRYTPLPVSISTDSRYESWIADFIHGIINNYLYKLNQPGLAGLAVYYNNSTHELHATGFTADNDSISFTLPAPPEYIPRSLFTLRNSSRAYSNPVSQQRS